MGCFKIFDLLWREQHYSFKFLFKLQPNKKQDIDENTAIIP